MTTRFFVKATTGRGRCVYGPMRSPCQGTICLSLMAQARLANQEFWDWVSFTKMLSGANAFEISDIQEDETERC